MEINDSARESWPALMEQAQAGDQLAYTRLLKALVPVIRSQIRKRIADDALVEDVIQDVLLTVHRVRHTYDPSYPFLPWLMAIISARAVDALRRRGRYQQWEIPEETLPEPATSADPQKRDSREELAGYLRQLLPPTSHCGACPSARNEPDGSRCT
jgi:RNA polymerase sigma-70 factor (ECF subfamily)